MFDGPQPLCGGVDLNPNQMLFVDAAVPQPGKVGRLRRPHHHHGAAAGNDAAKSWSDEAPLEHRGLRAQDLGDGLAGPTTTREFSIEVREAAGHHRASVMPEVAATPDGLLDLRGQLARLGAPGAGFRRMSEALGRQLIIVAGP